MSRVGKEPISVPRGIEVQLQERQVRVKGPRGELRVPVHPLATVQQEDGTLTVRVEQEDDRKARAMWGLTRALLANAVEGVSKGFEKRVVVVGVGYRADVKGKSLDLQVGFSHPVTVEPPSGISFTVEGPPAGVDDAQATVIVQGADKELVGRITAEIRAIRPPEPYKGKGIRYADEYVRRKAGKAAV